MISADLSGKTVLVTGGASGIGLVLADAFARCGASVALNHLPDDPRGPAQVERLKSGGAGVMGSGSSILYATSKAGLINLTRSLARILAPEIRVNAVAPGFVDSLWNKDWLEDRKVISIERTPFKRACKLEDIAETIFFLC